MSGANGGATIRSMRQIPTLIQPQRSVLTQIFTQPRAERENTDVNTTGGDILAIKVEENTQRTHQIDSKKR